MSAAWVVNPAVTFRSPFSVTVHGAVPVHPPLHPANVEPAPGVAVSVRAVPLAYVPLQALPQAIPVGSLVMVPEPVPLLATVRRI